MQASEKTGLPHNSEDRVRSVVEYLEEEVWLRVGPDVLGSKMTKREREQFLGIGPGGYPE